MKKITTILLLFISAYSYGQVNWTPGVGAWQLKDTIGGKNLRFRSSAGVITPVITKPSLSDSLKNYAKKIQIGNYATPQQYGAVGDGITDDTDAIQACLINNDNVLLFGEYLITDYLEIRENQKIYSQNAKITRSVTNSSTFIALNVDGWQISGKLEIIGAGKANGTATAINVVGCKRFDIRGVTIRNISGYGILINSGSDASPRGEGGLLINNWFIDNWYGVETRAGAEGEYNSLVNNNFTGNNTALSVNAGNTSVIGGNIVDNNIGLFIGGDLSTNGAHGIISGVNVNHNTLNFYGYNIDLGQTIDGCHFYGDATASIKLENCIGVNFDNCIIDGKFESIAGSLAGVNLVSNSQIEPSFFTAGDHISSTLFSKNFTKSGGYWSGNNEFLFGRTLIGTTTDNGIDRLQVNGTASFSPGTQPNQGVIKSQLDSAIISGGSSYTFASPLTETSGTVSIDLLPIPITDSDIISALTGATYTNNRATITPAGSKIMYAGQLYDDGTYTYIAISNNSIRRW